MTLQNGRGLGDSLHFLDGSRAQTSLASIQLTRGWNVDQEEQLSIGLSGSCFPLALRQFFYRSGDHCGRVAVCTGSASRITSCGTERGAFSATAISRSACSLRPSRVV